MDEKQLLAELKKFKVTHFISKNYSGKFMVRVPPEVHRNLAIQAAEAGVSINRLVSSRLSH